MKRMHRNILLATALALLAIARIVQGAEVMLPMPQDIDLNGTEWWVEDIEGKGVIDMSRTTIHFFEAGKVAGDTGCNRYTGSVNLQGPYLAFGLLAGTRKACAPSLMDQESKFYQALGKVVGLEVPETGLLHLKDNDRNTVIRAWRVED